MLGYQWMRGIKKHLFSAVMFEVVTAQFITLKSKRNHQHYPTAISHPLSSTALGSRLCVFV